jgi:xanthine dehydrogenase accessory factor
VDYVALVASPKRAAALVDALRASGVSETELGRLKSPAGLDIGAATPPEIALSILAEIVQRRRARRGVGVALTSAAQQPEQAYAIDPMCGMQVEIATARWTAEREGRTSYFCAPGCRKAFLSQSSAV